MGDEEDPLADLAADVGERGNGEGDDLFKEVFAEMETADLDPEEVWSELEGGDEAADEGSDVRVQHRSVCHGCKYFSTPPEMHCNHEGTEILEVVDTDHYEVVDCPMMVGDDFE